MAHSDTKPQHQSSRQYQRSTSRQRCPTRPPILNLNATWRRFSTRSLSPRHAGIYHHPHCYSLRIHLHPHLQPYTIPHHSPTHISTFNARHIPPTHDIGPHPNRGGPRHAAYKSRPKHSSNPPPPASAPPPQHIHGCPLHPCPILPDQPSRPPNPSTARPPALQQKPRRFTPSRRTLHIAAAGYGACRPSRPQGPRLQSSPRLLPLLANRHDKHAQREVISSSTKSTHASACAPSRFPPEHCPPPYTSPLQIQSREHQEQVLQRLRSWLSPSVSVPATHHACSKPP